MDERKRPVVENVPEDKRVNPRLTGVTNLNDALDPEVALEPDELLVVTEAETTGEDCRQNPLFPTISRVKKQ